MATHFVSCPCCGANHCNERSLESKVDKRKNETNQSIGKEECKICRITNACRRSELRDLGKNHSDCRFLHPVQLEHYHRNIPGYGDAVDFDLAVHRWNCAGHSHCKHGTLGLVEENAVTMQRNPTQGYLRTFNNCDCHPLYCVYNRDIYPN